MEEQIAGLLEAVNYISMHTIARFEGINSPGGSHTAAGRVAVQPDLFDMAAHKEGRIPVEHTEAVEKHLAGSVYFYKGQEPCLADHGLKVVVDSWHTLDVLAGQKSEPLSRHSQLVS